MSAFAASFWSITMKISDNYYKSYSYLPIMILINAILAFMLLLYKNPIRGFTILSIFTGIFQALTIYFYSKAIKSTNNPGIVASLVRVQVLLTFILSIFILHTQFDVKKLVSICVIIIGAYIVIRGEGKRKNDKSKHFIIYTIIASIMYSLFDIFTKLSLNKVNIYYHLVIMLITAFIVFSILQICEYKNYGLVKPEKKTKGDIKLFNKYNILSVILSGVFNFLVVYLLIKSIGSSSDPSYPKAVMAISIIITTVLSKFMVKNANTNTTEIIGIITILIGVGGVALL